jgi:hypothetical protein
MRKNEAVAVAFACLATLCSPLAAQRTRDRPTLIFTVSLAYLDGLNLWSVADQPVPDASGNVPLIDHFALRRDVKRTIGGGFSGTYYKGRHLGITAEAFLLGLGYDDGCRLVAPAESQANVERCNSIEQKERSAASVVTSAGLLYRIASDEFISPFVRATAGVLINNQSPLFVVAQQQNTAEVIIYADENLGTRIRPAFTLGVGTTIAAGRGYQLRWEVRDNIVGIQAVTGPASGRGLVPPHETVYKHMFSLNVGFDVILERVRGRRY